MVEEINNPPDRGYKILLSSEKVFLELFGLPEQTRNEVLRILMKRTMRK